MIANRIRTIAHRFRSSPALRRLEPAWKVLHPAYDSAVRFIAERELRTMPGGQDRWRFDASFHDFPFERIEPHVYAWISDHVSRSTQFYDVGAFIGYHSLCAAKRVQKVDGVFAFEAAPSNRALLKRHLRMNALENRVRVFDVAIGAEDHDRIPFFLRETDTSSHSLAFGTALEQQDQSALTRLEVPQRSIDSIVDETRQPPDAMKIDVEGAEGRVLTGAATTLRERRIPVLCAIHPMWLAGVGDDVDSLMKLIRSIGYRVFDMQGRSLSSLALEDVQLLPD
jgi:FkbM family methyltransferase